MLVDEVGNSFNETENEEWGNKISHKKWSRSCDITGIMWILDNNEKRSLKILHSDESRREVRYQEQMFAVDQNHGLSRIQ